MNNHFTKFECKGMNTLELKITQTRHPKSVSDGPSGPSTRPHFAKASQVKRLLVKGQIYQGQMSCKLIVVIMRRATTS